MNVTLQVNGQEMTFSEQELSSILEEHFSSKTTQQTTTAKVAQGPTEGVWFEVKPQDIDQKLFKKKRNGNRQEKTRQLILEAFAEMKKNPEEYGKNFKTMMRTMTWWTGQTVAQLKEMSSNLGDHNADWVEQALEWAQRIANGESWEAICNFWDTAKFYRLVVWKNGYARKVGGAAYFEGDEPASYVDDCDYYDDTELWDTVPLVVLYE